MRHFTTFVTFVKNSGFLAICRRVQTRSSRFFPSSRQESACPEDREVSRKWILYGCACGTRAKSQKVTKVVILVVLPLPSPRMSGIQLSPPESVSGLFNGHFYPDLSNLSPIPSFPLFRNPWIPAAEGRQLWAELPAEVLLPRLGKPSEPRTSSSLPERLRRMQHRTVVRSGVPGVVYTGQGREVYTRAGYRRVHWAELPTRL